VNYLLSPGPVLSDSCVLWDPLSSTSIASMSEVGVSEGRESKSMRSRMHGAWLSTGTTLYLCLHRVATYGMMFIPSSIKLVTCF